MSKKRNHPYKRRRGGFPDAAHPEEGRESPAHGAAPHADDADVIAIRRAPGDGTRRRPTPPSSSATAKAPAARASRKPAARRPATPSSQPTQARAVGRAKPEPNPVANAAHGVRESESRTPAALAVRAWRAIGHAIGAPRRWLRNTLVLLRERAADRT